MYRMIVALVAAGLVAGCGQFPWPQAYQQPAPQPEPIVVNVQTQPVERVVYREAPPRVIETREVVYREAPRSEVIVVNNTPPTVINRTVIRNRGHGYRSPHGHHHFGWWYAGGHHCPPQRRRGGGHPPSPPPHQQPPPGRGNPSRGRGKRLPGPGGGGNGGGSGPSVLSQQGVAETAPAPAPVVKKPAPARGTRETPGPTETAAVSRGSR